MRLTPIILLMSLLCISQSACTEFKASRAENKAAEQVRRDSIVQVNEAKELAKEVAIAAAIEEAQNAQEAAPTEIIQLNTDSLLLQFERRPCFGRCPIYKIKIYESGYTTYQGVNFVDYMGLYQHKLSPSELLTVYSLLERSDFFSLEDEYDDASAVDMASMIFKARFAGQEKRILARVGVPESLKEMGKSIDALFSETEWEAVTD